MKKRIYLMLCVCLACSIILFLAIIGNYDLNHSLNLYPWNRAAQWYCEEIDMTIQFKYNEDGEYIGSEYCDLTVKEKTYRAGIGFQASTIGFFVDEDGDDIWERVLDGIWNFRQDNMVIQIQEESVFGGNFTELVFIPCEK